ncbi:MAG: 5-methyltetrahydropteroyltriglutamate--homocysteine S-methyltransferase [Chitinophagales bacterium]|nr:5-methyltetrahydropteroyltriglutamate--homocysteine S-methyltransferase [Chitinophagales bacterium]MDW8428333.1 5-methyltetrahydropteroyltriglutamate--homocysteine S-methyltransferase [Chitinophagales bacterium]
MLTHNLGYPRIGTFRQLKKACEQYWSGTSSLQQLLQTGQQVRKLNWELQKQTGIDLIPANDFSYYDHVLDMTLTVGAIPERFEPLQHDITKNVMDLYFAMARGIQQGSLDITAMEMTKWFDTNYHYIVPEFKKNQSFRLSSTKIFDEFIEAKNLGIHTKPVVIGPVSFLLLGKEKEAGFHRLSLIDNILPVYIELLKKLEQLGADWVQIDEPFLITDLTQHEKEVYSYAFGELHRQVASVRLLLTTYFEGLRDNLDLALSLPVSAVHVDLIRDPEQLPEILQALPQSMMLSLGIIDGRNIWKNDFDHSLQVIQQTLKHVSEDRVLLAPSCSLLHIPCDLDLERDMPEEIKSWMAFAKQKLEELVILKKLINPQQQAEVWEKLRENREARNSRKQSSRIHHPLVQERLAALSDAAIQRQNPFPVRKQKQQKVFPLPLFPTTTIGSFPQTAEVRQWRARLKKGELSQQQYDELVKKEIEKTIRWQEQVGLDVLVHGEFERNDMVEYFGEQMEGFVFTTHGWVQSYGSRCVKPPIIYGDVYRPRPMTVSWATYAQSLTSRPVKGMLTGPVTMLQWSFVRDDQPRERTCLQLALAIRDEVKDLEQAGIRIIQIDEPALREGLPLRKADWPQYLQWAVRSFRIAASGVKDETQIHTHMCYSEFNDIIESIANMDADVITIECSRSQMELLDAFSDFKYPNDIGPGVYDIHSPRVPSSAEMAALLEKACTVINPQQLWVNPDCGLKTRRWEETQRALAEMVAAARHMRQRYSANVLK